MKFIARINWIRPENNGRRRSIPFDTEMYGPQIKYEGLVGNWSLVVNNFKKIDDYTTLAKIHFLNAEKAPKKLAIGLDFFLYEGSQKVAFGEVIEFS